MSDSAPSNQLNAQGTLLTHALWGIKLHNIQLDLHQSVRQEEEWKHGQKSNNDLSG